MQLEAGSFLRDYEIEKLLGKGGMGTVYLAKDSFLDRRVAIKELSPLLTADSELVQRFRNEARMQAKLNHANIVSLHSFFEQSGRYYMVMEYAEGRTLKELINQIGPIPEKRALNILRQLVSALQYAHELGIVHRDIKPSNIILDANDRVKILDFGIARIMGERGLTQTGQQLGTVVYMSPEQVKAFKDIDGRSDIYSLGVSFFEMLSGRRPYDLNTDSDFEIMTKIVQNPLPDPRSYYPHISDKTVNILNKMIEKDRNLRYPNALKIAQDIDGNLSGQQNSSYVPQYDMPMRNKPSNVVSDAEQISDKSDYGMNKTSITKMYVLQSIVAIAAIVSWFIISSIFVDIFDDPTLIVVSLFIATIGMVIFTFKNVVNTQKFLDKKQYKEAYLSSVRNRKFNKIIFIFAAVFFIIGIILD
ncbi:MAG: serine/threonine protein kinase [Candidatus Cloacimonetes bacterium]|nr:serine/threonine protein kinase [Candidatus Cloacimonadota bacterium]